jgi:hypothetical protein
MIVPPKKPIGRHLYLGGVSPLRDQNKRAPAGLDRRMRTGMDETAYPPGKKPDC